MAGYIGSKASVTQVDGYNKAEGDTRYVEIAGDTMTGALLGTDLTLSGGVYLGGTGSSNKLDDYEEGEFTYSLPCETSGSFTVRANYASGFYTKVKRLVTIHLRFETLGRSSPVGNITLSGLPFVVDSTVSTGGNASFQYPITLRGLSNTSFDTNFYVIPNPNTFIAKFYGQGTSSSHSATALDAADVATNFEGAMCFTYKTNA